MPATDGAASVRRDGDALVFAGALERDAVAALWRPAQALIPGAARLDLRAVPHLDSGGLAMLAELAARADHGLAITGEPDGLAGLRAAYRLDEGLSATR